MESQPRSFCLDASGLDELGPSVRVVADESRELAGSAGEALDAEIGEARSESGIGEGRVNLLVEPPDDLRGRILRRADESQALAS